nr:immunoglobulin heavy chain junction region [Mus musculus]
CARSYYGYPYYFDYW